MFDISTYINYIMSILRLSIFIHCSDLALLNSDSFSIKKRRKKTTLKFLHILN